MVLVILASACTSQAQLSTTASSPAISAVEWRDYTAAKLSNNNYSSGVTEYLIHNIKWSI